jgi:hypothetical protein
MSRLGKYSKVPADYKRYTIDYSEWLDGGETVSSVDLAIDVNTDATPLVVDSSSIISSGTGVEFFVGGGEAGETYNVLVTITTSDTEIREDTVFFSVKSPT